MLAGAAAGAGHTFAPQAFDLMYAQPPQAQPPILFYSGACAYRFGLRVRLGGYNIQIGGLLHCKSNTFF